jgi:hypothetical protein
MVTGSTRSQVVVITSIFPPTEAVHRFTEMPGWSLVVAGDKKTPGDWKRDGATMLDIAEQERMGCRIGKQLPFNHYCRKLYGYLWAVRCGAQVIADTDDDNIPYPNWAFDPFDGTYDKTAADLGFVNIYSLFTDMKIWPRGLPLDQVINPKSILKASDLKAGKSRVGIWQGLADGDPDVDAVYRLTVNLPCTFSPRNPVVLSAGTLSPFNSQNTFYRKELFPLLYLPAFVTFRFTDILRGLVAQPILWAAGYELGFSNATVFQERNPHDYTKDFESEVPMYLHGAKVPAIVANVVTPAASVADNLFNAYEALHKAGIVPANELPLLKCWLDDLAEK